MAKFWPLHHYCQCMGKNRRKDTWHHLAYLMGEGACQLDILGGPSCGRRLTYETRRWSLTLTTSGGA